MLNKIFVIFLLYLTINAQKYSSLQLSNYDVNLKRIDTKKYSISIKLAYQSDAITNTIFCFKQMVNIPDKNNQNCDLIQKNQFYLCVEVNYTRVPSVAFLTNTLGVFKFHSNKAFQNLNESLYSPQVKAENITRTITVTNFLDDYKIYHMISAASRQTLLTYDQFDSQSTLSYAHTYAHSTYFDTLITQRYYHCILYQDKIIYIFQGAVSRDGLSHYFTGILTTTTTNLPFHMWGGYSYSSGHAARDMIGYQSNTGNFYDMYSLYASAPFNDVAENIKGEKNVVRIGNSGSSSTQTIPYHFIQFYRLFDTADLNGDEIIMEKIYNRFCFAAYFQNYTSGQASQISVMSNSFKHQLIDCHIPNLAIYQRNMYFVWLSIVFVLCLII